MDKETLNNENYMELPVSNDGNTVNEVLFGNSMHISSGELLDRSPHSFR